MDGDEPATQRTTGNDPRLYLDVMLGKLATILRMAGLDAAYAMDRGIEADDSILQEVHDEQRVLVTRDRQLAERTGEHPGSVLLTAKDVSEQVFELREAGFPIEFDVPVRCSSCNGRLELVDTSESTPGWVPEPGEEQVWRCGDCGQYFWKGSHWDDVVERLGRGSR